MKRISTFIIILMALSANLSAQNEQKEINDIKRNLNFLYATGTSTKDAAEASSNARELLSLEIEQWLKENANGDFSGYIAKSKQNMAEIRTQRGTLKRVFVYVKKTDILPYYKEENVMMVNTQAPNTTTLAVDTLTIVRTSADSEAKALQRKDIEQITKQDTRRPAFEPTESEKELLNVKNLTEINAYIKQGEKNGKVSAYGKYDADTRLFGKSYLFIFDREKMLAVLRKNGGDFVNLSNGQSDAISNYGRSGIVWVQLKEN